MPLQQLLEVVRPFHSSLRHILVRPWTPPPQARPPQTHGGTHLVLLPETVHGLLFPCESYLHPVMTCSGLLRSPQLQSQVSLGGAVSYRLVSALLTLT